MYHGIRHRLETDPNYVPDQFPNAQAFYQPKMSKEE